MANEEQLAILKQGVHVWNKWREESLVTENDLSGANLSGFDLNGAYLSIVNLEEAIIDRADLTGANLNGANLKGASLYETVLVEAKLRSTNLHSVNLSKADLRDADLFDADLYNANLIEAQLHGTNFDITFVSKTDFTSAEVSSTIFNSVDLREAIGLDGVLHFSSSKITTNTFNRSEGNIPEAFLRGCGLSDWEIETVKLYNPNLSNDEFIDIQNRIFDLRQRQAIQISPLFISYSHADSGYVDKIDHRLIDKGVRFWRDVHDMKAGRMEKQIDIAIRQNPTVLLVLSEHSLRSDWVEHEVRTARELEKDMKRDVLCPIALDDSWKSSRWPKRIMEQIMEYNILDFSGWEDDVKFEEMFRKLIDGLELFYKDKSHGE
jgi:uncharacterized protein YjbI with pentapeptide repeats